MGPTPKNTLPFFIATFMKEIKNKVNIKKNNLWFPCHQSTLLKEDRPQISHFLGSQGCDKAAGLWKNKTFMLEQDYHLALINRWQAIGCMDLQA